MLLEHSAQLWLWMNLGILRSFASDQKTINILKKFKKKKQNIDGMIGKVRTEWLMEDSYSFLEADKL